MYCRNCGNVVPDGSKYCGHCGASCLVNEDNSIPLSTTLNKPVKKSKKKKLIIIPIFFLIAILLLGVTYVGINYSLAMSAMNNQEFIKSKQYFDYLFVSEKVFPDKYEYVEAGILMDEGKYIEALDAFQNIDALPVPISILDGLKSKIYSDGQEAYRNGKIDDAQKLFNVIKDYEHSNDYLLLIYCRTNDLVSRSEANIKYSQLIDILDFEDTKEVIMNNENTATLFLAGNWRNGNYAFELQNNALRRITYNLPNEEVDEPYSISNSIMRFGTVEEFKFTIIDINTISVFCFSDGSTIKLYRRDNSVFNDN